MTKNKRERMERKKPREEKGRMNRRAVWNGNMEGKQGEGKGDRGMEEGKERYDEE